MRYTVVRIRPVWLLAAALVGGILTACAMPPPAAPAEPQFVVATDKPDNVVETVVEDGRLLVDVQSASGIGSAAVRLISGQMPPHLLLSLHLRGLEQMTFAFGDAVVRLSVPSGGDRPVLQSVTLAGQESEITPASPYWMEVTAPATGGDPYEVASPPAFAASPPADFTVGWIDFYR